MSRRLAGRALAALTTGALASAALGATPASADTGALGYDALTAKGALYNIAEVVGAHASYAAGFTGKGVGVALIDTGVTEVPGLTSGNVWHGPDLSLDSQVPELAHLDAYGHGTHLASIIAGRDQAGSPSSYLDPERFTGIAPDATLVSLKVGASDGAVDVSQVIAAIDWAVEHRNDPELNIRVINLSYGTDSLQDTAVDPLAFAVENAWNHGIVVVAAGGNDGSSTYTLANPARDPFVLSVGVDDTKGTVSTRDDEVPAWGSRGTNQRHVDVVAPGVSVLGLRVPDGFADSLHPDARVGTRFAKASGTSQAAAVVSGEVALLLQESPSLTPDQVKKKLMNTAENVPLESTQYRGNGVSDARTAQVVADSAARQTGTAARGTGSLEASRGSSHVSDGGTPISGEVDVFGHAWDGAAWAAATANETVWVGGTWRGLPLVGDGWDGRTWRSADWSGQSWTGQSWAGQSWSGGRWSGQSWTGQSWSGGRWSGGRWSGESWRTADLAGASWS